MDAATAAGGQIIFGATGEQLIQDESGAVIGAYALTAEGISQARSVRGYPDWFYVLGQGEVLGVPTQLWIFGILAVVAAVSAASRADSAPVFACPA